MYLPSSPNATHGYATVDATRVEDTAISQKPNNQQLCTHSQDIMFSFITTVGKTFVFL
jgi:hypothetical protein